MNKKIFILGISSFSGSSTAKYLLDRNYKVFGTYNTKKNKFYLPFKESSLFKNYKGYKIDLTKKKDLNKVLELIKKIKPSIIIDFASLCMVNESWLYPEKYFDLNVKSKSYLFRKIFTLDYVSKLIYISTPEVFGSNNKSIKEINSKYSPSTPYATSKMAAELIIKNYNSSISEKGIIARFSNFYGPGQPNYRLIPKLLMSIKNKKKFPLHGKGNSIRNFIYTDDFSEGILKIILHGKTGKIYHFGGLEFISVMQIIKKVCKIKNKSFNKVISLERDRVGKDKIYKLNCEFTKRKLKWNNKTDLNTGLNRMVDFVEQNYKKLGKYSLTF